LINLRVARTHSQHTATTTVHALSAEIFSARTTSRYIAAREIGCICISWRITQLAARTIK
jgi:hypothetical protein